MSPDKQNKLYSDFPLLFQEKDLPMTQTCMCWGFECGDGWFDIIYNICEYIQNYIDQTIEDIKRDTIYNEALTAAQNGNFTLWDASFSYRPRSDYVMRNIPSQVEQVVFTQVKEKFGVLTIYANGGDDVTDAIIHFGSRLSSKICEVCGNRGTINRGGWLRCRCPEHAED